MRASCSPSASWLFFVCARAGAQCFFPYQFFLFLFFACALCRSTNKKASASAARKAAAKKVSGFGAKKAAAGGKQQAAGGGGKRKRDDPADQNDWQAVEAADYAVLVRAQTKGGKKQTKVVRRSLDRDGGYMPLSKQKLNPAMITTPIMRVVGMSTMAGEGNVGTGKDYDINRGNCHFNVGLACGQVDGVELKDGLLEEQVTWVKKIYTICRNLLAQTFDAATEEWKKPIERAYTDARRELCSEFGARKPIQMPDIEEENEEAREKVKNRAREIFIEGAKSIPGAPKEDNDGEFDSDDMPVIWATGKVWSWEHFDPSRDSQSTEKGPSLEITPSARENWGKILDEMEGPMRRKYKYIKYQDAATMKEIPRPTIRVTRTRNDIATGAEVKTEAIVPDPFWNPVLESTKGKPLDSMIKTNLVFTVYRGPLTSDNTYGVKFYLGPMVSIVARRVRRAQLIPMTNEGPVEGMTNIDEDDDDDEDEPEQTAPAVTEKPEEGEVVEDDDDKDTQDAKRARKDEDEDGNEADDDDLDDVDVDDDLSD